MERGGYYYRPNLNHPIQPIDLTKSNIGVNHSNQLHGDKDTYTSSSTKRAIACLNTELDSEPQTSKRRRLCPPHATSRCSTAAFAEKDDKRKDKTINYSKAKVIADMFQTHGLSAEAEKHTPSLQIPSTRIGINQPLGEVLCSSDALEKLADNYNTCMSIQVKHKDCNDNLVTRDVTHGIPERVITWEETDEGRHCWSSAPKLPNPGDICRADSVRAAYAMSDKQDSKEAWRASSYLSLNLLLLTRPYKNDYKAIIENVKAVINSSNNGTGRIQSFWFGGSGGAAQRIGGQAKDLKQCTNPLTGQLPTPQSHDNKHNAAMLHAFARDSVFSVFVGQDFVSRDKDLCKLFDGIDAETFIYLGQFSADTYRYGKTRACDLDEYYESVLFPDTKDCIKKREGVTAMKINDKQQEQIHKRRQQ